MSEVDPNRVVGTLLVKACGVLSSFGGRPSDDAWRASARAHLGGEASRFMLAALGLTSEPAPPALLKRLALFLREQPLAACALEWHGDNPVRVPKETVDVTWARFDPSGRLLSIDPLLDERAPISYERFLRGLLADLIVEAYNETRFLSDRARPLATTDYAASRIDAVVVGAALPQDAREAARTWVWRVLTSTMVTFERLHGAADPRRFVVPQLLDARQPGCSVFDIRVRQVDEATVDLWVQASPLAVDGMPLHEMMASLRSAWGSVPAEFPVSGSEPVAEALPGQVHDGTIVVEAAVPPAPALLPASFESPSAARRPWTRPLRCSAEADPPHVYTALEYLDLAPFLEVRRALGMVSPTAMLLWMLGHQPAFADRRFAVWADVPARDDAPRTTGLVVLRPADYFPGVFAGSGFEAFSTAFEREVELARRRQSEAWAALQRMACIPSAGARLASTVEREALGTVGVSVVRGAEILVAPWHPLLVDGCIGIGDFAHLAAGGAARCAVSFKGGRRRLEACREALLSVMETPRRYFPL